MERFNSLWNVLTVYGTFNRFKNVSKVVSTFLQFAGHLICGSRSMFIECLYSGSTYQNYKYTEPNKLRFSIQKGGFSTKLV